MPDIITFGELLIDFVPTVSGVTLAEAQKFIKAPGGAPANVAVGLARLGVESGFVGKIGDDAFGHFLATTLEADGVDTSRLMFSKEARTMLAFVSLKKDGERDFMFYRHPSADMLFGPKDIDQEYLESAKIFHFGSISLICDPAREATFKAVRIARDAGLIVSYDPNLRLGLWDSPADAREGILSAWPFAQVIKVSEEEVAFLKKTSKLQDLERSVRSLWHDRLRLLVVTQAGAGCTFFTPNFSGRVEGFDVPTVDTTGAGDSFTAAFLKGMLDNPDGLGSRATLNNICRFANAAGALTTTSRGAISALPKGEEVEALLNKHEVFEG
jgi:fructokinase